MDINTDLDKRPMVYFYEFIQPHYLEFSIEKSFTTIWSTTNQKILSQGHYVTSVRPFLW